MAEPAATPAARPGRFRLLVNVGLFLLMLVLTVAVLLLLENIRTHKQEGKEVVFRVVNLDETVTDPAQWGKNFPRQYDSYLRTVDVERTRYGGSEAISKIDADPRLKTMWAGYAFAVDFNEERGHAYMLSDQRETRRVHDPFKQPGACLHCHASVTTAYRQVGLEKGAPGKATDPLTSPEGQAQLMKGFAEVCAMPYPEATKLVQHPVACIDCHDPESMQLRVSRPGFMEGIQALAQSSEPTPHLPSIERWRQGDRSRPYDPNRDATRQEMRSMACGQCHVEYYFKGPEKRLTFPWHNGLKVEQMLEYYDKPVFKDKDGNTGAFYDWKHKVSGAPVIKAQHPEFELWSQGIHARSGVACADCHMPYMREGAIKISDHHIRSPLLNIDRSCQTCHRFPEEELLARAEKIQERTKDLMDRAMDALVQLIAAIESAKTAGADDARLRQARELQRQAQFRVDFINAENSMGFHAPQEAARILGEAIDLARQGQIDLLQPAAATVAAAPAGDAPAAPATAPTSAPTTH